MPRIAYVNGRYLPHHAATVHIEDRGYQFADGVYEVIAVHGGALVDGDAHLDRLEYSLGELNIAAPMSRRALLVVMKEVIRRNRLKTGALYLQITRGVASRDHVFPEDLENSSLIVNTRPLRIPDSSKVDAVRVITTPDIRWKRPDIKSIALLPNVLARVEARRKGAFEAWMVDEEGFVTEGGASNAWIIDGDGSVITRPLSQAILSGITRKTLIRLANERQIPIVERPFTVSEAKEAKEAFLTSATSFVKPVGQIDDTIIGDGTPGPITTRLLEEYLSFMNALSA